MHRPSPSFFLVAFFAFACGPGPDGAGDPDRPLPARPDQSSLAECLLEGGRFVAEWHRDLDAAGVSALAVAADGSIAVGEGLGAVGILREALAADSMADVFHEILLPAGGHAATSLSFSKDGRTLVSGDAVGQVASISLAPNGPLMWERVSEGAILSVAARARGEAVAWVDESYSGQPTLWAWPEQMEAPDPVSTVLWGANDTAFDPEDALWVVAGDWYGVPAFDLRLADAPDVLVASWMMSMETLREAGSSGFVMAVAFGGDDMLLAGTHPFLGEADGNGGGFLAAVDLLGVMAAPPAEEEEAPALPEGRLIRFEDHRPVDAHLLPGDGVLITAGADGDVVAWTVDGFERLASFEVEDLGATAVDFDGSVLLAGDGTGRLMGLGCAP